MSKQTSVVHYDPLYVISLPVGAAALEQGDLLSFESSTVVLFDLAAENVTFVGMGGGKSAASTGDFIDVYMKCWADMALTSATYALGAGLKYTSKNTLVADGNADTIGWVWDFNTATRTRGKVYFNVPLLSQTSGYLFDIVTI